MLEFTALVDKAATRALQRATQKRKAHVCLDDLRGSGIFTDELEQAAQKTWFVQFYHVRPLLHDELRLAIYTPFGIYIYVHDGLSRFHL